MNTIIFREIVEAVNNEPRNSGMATEAYHVLSLPRQTESPV